MKKYNGQLKLKNIEDSIEYGVYSGSSFDNITKLFMSNLGEKVQLKVKKGGYYVINHTGKLTLQRIDKLKLFYIDNLDIDNILWDNLEEQVEFSFRVL